jgi:hypothetical protein
MEFEKEQVWRRLSSNGGYETYYAQANEAERKTFQQWFKSLLWEQKVLVEFVKSDGSARVMECTLNDVYGAKYSERDLTESTDSVTVTPQRKQNEHVCVVWDVKQSAWRSFRWDRLKKIEFASEKMQ